MKATIINCTLKSSPEVSNTEALARVVIESLEARDVECELIRAVDFDLKPGVESDMGDGDEWPSIRSKIVESEILVIATPTWFGQPSSVSKRVLERMDAMLSETDDDGVPVAYNRVAGAIVTGNEDGAHHVIAEIFSALGDIGYTVPGQGWTYWNKGPGPGETYLESDEGKDWAKETGQAAAGNLVAVARALQANPIPAPDTD